MLKVNGKLVNFDKFPNNETLFKDQFGHIFDKFKVNISFKYEDDSDLIKLMLVKNRIDEIFTGKVMLSVMYMPYSRMDRAGGNINFTLKYISNFINNLNFNEVIIYEPHSDVCLELIDNSEARYFTPYLLDVFKHEIEPDYIMFPDKGARLRYESLFPNYSIISANKKRDFDTGKIQDLEILDNFERGSTVVILDDLSSFGGTFLWSAEKLKEKGAGDIYLIVGHSEESILNGKIPDSDLIKKVYTTNSIINKNKENNKIIIKEMI